jgi:dipeptidyl-peptidase-3
MCTVRLNLHFRTEGKKLTARSLKQALEYVANDMQTKILQHYIESFHTGNLQPYRESQRAWTTDKCPSVEHVLGFVAPYNDPCGLRAQWEGAVCIADHAGMERMKSS